MPAAACSAGRSSGRVGRRRTRGRPLPAPARWRRARWGGGCHLVALQQTQHRAGAQGEHREGGRSFDGGLDEQRFVAAGAGGGGVDVQQGEDWALGLRGFQQLSRLRRQHEARLQHVAKPRCPTDRRTLGLQTGDVAVQRAQTHPQRLRQLGATDRPRVAAQRLERGQEAFGARRGDGGVGSGKPPQTPCTKRCPCTSPCGSISSVACGWSRTVRT